MSSNLDVNLKRNTKNYLKNFFGPSKKLMGAGTAKINPLPYPILDHSVKFSKETDNQNKGKAVEILVSITRVYNLSKHPSFCAIYFEKDSKIKKNL